MTPTIQALVERLRALQEKWQADARRMRNQGLKIRQRGDLTAVGGPSADENNVHGDSLCDAALTWEDAANELAAALTSSAPTPTLEQLREFLLDECESSDRQAAARWKIDPSNPEIAKQLAVRRQAFAEVLHWLNNPKNQPSAPTPTCGWLAIASAPKDGTWILVFVPSTGRTHVCQWDAEYETVYREGTDAASYRGAWTDHAVVSFGYEETHEYQPTHWQPMLDPPPVSRPREAPTGTPGETP